MANQPSEDHSSENKPRFHPRAPKAKPLFPDTSPEELPEILRVDERTVTAIRTIINDALEGKELRVNSEQVTFIVEYVRYCMQHKLDVKRNLAAAALYFLRKQPDRDPRTLKILQATIPIVEDAKKLEGREAEIIIINDPITTETEQRTPEAPPNYLKQAQEALGMSNYDDATILAAHAAGLPGAKAEAILCAGICYTLRATKKPGSAESKIEDLGQALEFFEKFMMRSKEDTKALGQRTAVQAKIRDVSRMRTELMRKHSKKK